MVAPLKKIRKGVSATGDIPTEAGSLPGIPEDSRVPSAGVVRSTLIPRAAAAAAGTSSSGGAATSSAASAAAGTAGPIETADLTATAGSAAIGTAGPIETGSAATAAGSAVNAVLLEQYEDMIERFDSDYPLKTDFKIRYIDTQTVENQKKFRDYISKRDAAIPHKRLLKEKLNEAIRKLESSEPLESSKQDEISKLYLKYLTAVSDVNMEVRSLAKTFPEIKDGRELREIFGSKAASSVVAPSSADTTTSRSAPTSAGASSAAPASKKTFGIKDVSVDPKAAADLDKTAKNFIKELYDSKNSRYFDLPDQAKLETQLKEQKSVSIKVKNANGLVIPNVELSITPGKSVELSAAESDFNDKLTAEGMAKAMVYAAKAAGLGQNGRKLVITGDAQGNSFKYIFAAALLAKLNLYINDSNRGLEIAEMIDGIEAKILGQFRKLFDEHVSFSDPDIKLQLLEKIDTRIAEEAKEVASKSLPAKPDKPVARAATKADSIVSAPDSSASKASVAAKSTTPKAPLPTPVAGAFLGRRESKASTPPDASVISGVSPTIADLPSKKDAGSTGDPTVTRSPTAAAIAASSSASKLPTGAASIAATASPTGPDTPSSVASSRLTGPTSIVSPTALSGSASVPIGSAAPASVLSAATAASSGSVAPAAASATSAAATALTGSAAAATAAGPGIATSRHVASGGPGI